MKRTALRRRTTPLRRNKRLNPVSVKKAVERDAWADIRDAKLAETPFCEAPRKLVAAFDLNPSRLDAKRLSKALRACTGTAQDVHHTLQRSLGGTNDPAGLLSLCRSCHSWIDDNIALSHRIGLLRHSWEATA